ncbi:hypothetical protein OT109_03235 [Phycisphaeraceae bacterium D3-23]
MIIALIAALIGSGYLFNWFAWGEREFGGWFPPLVIAVVASPIILIPIVRGIVQGMREASKD